MDITPSNLAGVKVSQISYHPSGAAIGYLVERENRSELWLGSNRGGNAEKLFASEDHEKITTLGFFPQSGDSLFFGLKNADGSARLSVLNLTDLKPHKDGLWQGRGDISNIHATFDFQGVAFDLGQECEQRTALYVPGGILSEGRPLLKAQGKGSSVLGWVGGGNLIVGSGCEKMDVWLVNVATGENTLLVENVRGASSRLKNPSGDPPPALGISGVP